MNYTPDKIRVMWLLNHATARSSEVEQLRRLGIEEVFVPKSFPVDESNLSGSVDNSLDASLTIPPDDLVVLNAADWYDDPGPQAWAIANRYFKIAFFAFFPRQIEAVTRYFEGTCILRVFGLQKEASYSELLYQRLGVATVERIRSMGSRFWFGQAYEHLHEVEHDFLRRRECYLPLGISATGPASEWQGDDRQVFFVCPRIGSSPYYEKLYREFIELIDGLPYKIGGAQPVKVPDGNVLGFVSRAQHDANMTRFRVIFYHDSGPNHIHYHPFEAVRAGMPVIFMAGGMLDRFGGEDLPGRCLTAKEARRKIKRVLDGDHRLVDSIRTTQVRLLAAMQPETCSVAWRKAFTGIAASFATDSSKEPGQVSARLKIAVILPIEYRGGTLRGAKLIARAVHSGSRTAGHPVDVVFAHLDNAQVYSDDLFEDLPSEIQRRPFRWAILDCEAANRAMRFSGHEMRLADEKYLVPDDGINNFLDCDLWLIVSDRVQLPMLPLRPYAVMVYDYIQRYQRLLTDGLDQPYVDFARNAAAVLVTTKFTHADAIQYAGLDEKKVHLVPMMWPGAPEFPAAPQAERNYFLWPTNPSIHKNHLNAAKALRIYYDDLDGTLECRVTGVESRSLFTGKSEHFRAVRETITSSQTTRRRVKPLGEIPDAAYFKELSGALFVWHPALVDNGTFCVVEAAAVGVPSLSSDYPAMREMDANFALKLAWCDPNNPRQMAEQLKWMESHADARRSILPKRDALLRDVDHSAPAYWEAVRSCL